MTRLSWRTAGESHGKTLIGVVEGVPAGLTLDTERIDAELLRRQGGYGRGGRMKIERDHIEILSGLKGGVTLGSPIAFEVPNRDQTIEDLPTPKSPRPGHADLAGCQKYGHQDARAILERASARETAARVAAAADRLEGCAQQAESGARYVTVPEVPGVTIRKCVMMLFSATLP